MWPPVQGDSNAGAQELDSAQTETVLSCPSELPKALTRGARLIAVLTPKDSMLPILHAVVFEWRTDRIPDQLSGIPKQE